MSLSTSIIKFLQQREFILQSRFFSCLHDILLYIQDLNSELLINIHYGTVKHHEKFFVSPPKVLPVKATATLSAQGPIDKLSFIKENIYVRETTHVN